MLRHERRLIGLFLPMGLVGLFALATVASAQKARRDTVAFTPPNVSLSAEPRVVTVCEGSGPAVVHLNAQVMCRNTLPGSLTTWLIREASMRNAS